jgi:hypothetical protein
MKLRLGCVGIAFVSLVLSMPAQTTSSNAGATTTPAATTAAVVTTAQVPRLVRFTGTVTGVGGNAPGGVVGVTFSLYAEQTGGAPLWSEVQNVQVDKTGHYTVMLGSTTADGLPLSMFTAAQAQWLGVRVEAQAEQPRVMLLSVPYALKAADAETFGGKPPSAYVAAPQSDSSTGTAAALSNGSRPGVNSGHPLFLSGSGTPNYIPVWTSASNLASSNLWQASNGWLTWGEQAPIAPLAIVSSAKGGLYVEGVAGNTYSIVEASETDPTSQSPVIQAITNSNSTGMAVYGIAQDHAANNVAVEGVNASSNGTAVLGSATATSGLTVGVSGQTASGAGAGVVGINSGTTGNGVGVNGQAFGATATAVLGHNKTTSGGPSIGALGVTDSPDGIGIYGTGVSQSNEGGTVTLRPVGVWGDTNQSSGIGVLATADFGIAIAAYNNAENISTAKFENDENTDGSGNILATHGGHFGGICVIDVGGNLGCNGSKSAVVPVDGGTRKVALYAVEAPENWFEDFGSARLSEGSAVISMEPVFAQTVNTGLEYHVFLTPKGDCKGLYVTNETAESFEVREFGSGTANIAFDYRIVARRKGYETIRLADKTKRFDQVANEPGPVRGKVAPPVVPRPLLSRTEQK